MACPSRACLAFAAALLLLGLFAPEPVRAQAEPVCGNWIVEAGEACDDGNTTNGDCCSSVCQFEPVDSSCADGNVCNGAETCNGAGTCVAGAPLLCDDGDLCSQDSCDAVLGCMNDYTPKLTCNETMGRARLRMRQIETNPGRNRIRYKWVDGDASAVDHGDPTTSSAYALCVYDADGIVASSAVPAAAQCGDKDCWKAKSYRDETSGFLLNDRRARHEGMKAIKVKDGAGDSMARARAAGADLYVSQFGEGLMTPVTAQVVTSDADCWSTTFDAEEVRRNDAVRFDARHRAEPLD